MCIFNYIVLKHKGALILTMHFCFSSMSVMVNGHRSLFLTLGVAPFSSVGPLMGVQQGGVMMDDGSLSPYREPIQDDMFSRLYFRHLRESSGV